MKNEKIKQHNSCRYTKQLKKIPKGTTTPLVNTNIKC